MREIRKIVLGDMPFGCSVENRKSMAMQQNGDEKPTQTEVDVVVLTLEERSLPFAPLDIEIHFMKDVWDTLVSKQRGLVIAKPEDLPRGDVRGRDPRS